MQTTAVLLGLAVLTSWPATAGIRLDNGAFRVEAPAVEPAQGWATVFRVYSGPPGAPPMAGSYSIEGRDLLFRPRFPLASGVRYRAVLELPGKPPVETSFDGPKTAASPAARILAVYPTAAVLPANLLKLYIHFSQPMSRGEAWKRLRLLDESGAAVELPFLEIEQEMWDREFRRLTVLFDPGRIKRGLVPNDETGPPLVARKRYELVIDNQWRDARGVPLEAGFRKSFTVGPADRTPPDPKRWRIHTPGAGTRDPLVVHFGEPMDQALSEHLLHLERAGVGIDGSIHLTDNESRWSFEPAAPWTPGAYRLIVDRALEDLAGNRIGRAFDVDAFERVSRTIERKTVTLPVRIR